jgi:hypothetical protein
LFQAPPPETPNAAQPGKLMLAFRSWRHTIFAASIALYIFGVAGALLARFPSLMPVTTFLIAVAAWSYGPYVAVPVMLLAHALSAAVVIWMVGPTGVVTLHPALAVVPIAILECLLLLGLSSLRHLELRQAISEAELRRKNAQIEAALAEVRELRGLLPICAWCKNIRDVDGMWNRLESYLAHHSRAKLTHGICPECLDREMAHLATAR